MVVNFRARGISQSASKLARTPTLIKKKNLFVSYMVYKINKKKKVTWS